MKAMVYESYGGPEVPAAARGSLNRRTRQPKDLLIRVTGRGGDEIGLRDAQLPGTGELVLAAHAYRHGDQETQAFRFSDFTLPVR